MIRRLPPSALALIAVNAIPLAGVFFLDWRVFDLLALFWLENVIVGIINVLRMITGSLFNKDLGAIILGPFFCVHYGMFTFVHGIFVMSFFGRDAGISVGTDASLLALIDTVITQGGLLWGAVGLFGSHLLSFFINFIGRKEYQNLTMHKIMMAPYGRVVILHLTILLGGALIMATGETLAALTLLVILKTGVDLAAHLREHKTAAGTVA